MNRFQTNPNAVNCNVNLHKIKNIHGFFSDLTHQEEQAGEEGVSSHMYEFPECRMSHIQSAKCNVMAENVL
jgi:hypothetical protein